MFKKYFLIGVILVAFLGLMVAPATATTTTKKPKGIKLKEMAANCKPAFGLPAQSFETNDEDAFGVPSDMPK